MEFNKGISKEDQAKVTFDVKKGSVSKAVTPNWAEDGRSVELASTVKFAAGEYVVTVSGIEFAENANSGKVTVEDQKIKSIEIPATEVAKAALAEVKYVVKDNFDAEIESLADNFTWTIANNTDSSRVVAYSSTPTDKILKLNTAGTEIGDKLMVTGILKADPSIKVVKELIVANVSAKLTFEKVVLPEGKDRVTQNDGYLEVKYSMTNSLGETVKLKTNVLANANQDNVDGITFTTSDATIIPVEDGANNFTVTNGVLKFKVLNKAGDVTLTAINPATGESSSLVIKVEKTPFPSRIEIKKQPAEEITAGAGGKTTIQFRVFDQYNKEYEAAPGSGSIKVTKKSGGDAIIAAVGAANSILAANMLKEIELEGSGAGEEVLTFQLLDAASEKVGDPIQVDIKVIAEINSYKVTTDKTEYVSGKDIKITIQAQDADPKLIPLNGTVKDMIIEIGTGKDSYKRDVTFVSGEATVILPAKTAFAAEAVKVTDAATKTGSSDNITVTAGEVAQFLVQKGANPAQQIKITAADAAGNKVNSYDGDKWIMVAPKHSVFNKLNSEGQIKINFGTGQTADLDLSNPAANIPNGTFTFTDENGISGTYTKE